MISLSSLLGLGLWMSVASPSAASDGAEARAWLERQSVERDCRELHKLSAVQRAWINLLAEVKGRKVDRLRAVEILGACDPTEAARARLARVLHGDQPLEIQQAAASAIAQGWPALATPLLDVSLQGSPHPEVRAHVALTLGSLEQEEAITALRGRLKLEPDHTVKDAIRLALRKASG